MRKSSMAQVGTSNGFEAFVCRAGVVEAAWNNCREHFKH